MNDQPGLNDYVKMYDATKKPDAATVVGKKATLALGGSLGGVLGGMLGGAAASGIFGTTAMVSSLIPTGLLNALGLAAVVTTPVGWVLGGIAVCAGIGAGIAAGIGYGAHRLSHSGGKEDQKRAATGKGLLKKIEALFQGRAQPVATQHPASLADQTAQVEALFRELGQEGAIAANKVDYFVNNLRSGQLSIDDAIAILQEHGKELSHSTLNPAAPNAEIALQQAASARALTVMHKGVLNNPDQPAESFLIQMQQRFGIDRERAVELYRDAPLDSNPTATARQLADLFTQEIMRGALTALEETAQDMQQGQAAFVRFLEIQNTLQQQFNTQISAIDRAGEDALAAINRI